MFLSDSQLTRRISEKPAFDLIYLGGPSRGLDRVRTLSVFEVRCGHWNLPQRKQPQEETARKEIHESPCGDPWPLSGIGVRRKVAVANTPCGGRQCQGRVGKRT